MLILFFRFFFSPHSSFCFIDKVVHVSLNYDVHVFARNGLWFLIQRMVRDCGVGYGRFKRCW